MQKIDIWIQSFDNAVIPLYFYGLGAAVFFISFVWFFYLVLKNPTIVDAYWPIGLMVLAALFYVQRPVGGFGSWQAKLFLGSVVLWGCRLGIYLLARIVIEGKVDKRYAHLQKNWGKGWKMHFNCLLQYYFQALLQSLLALAFLGFVTNEDYYGWPFVAGLALAIVGIVFSAVADWQLSSFVAEKKKIVASGKPLSQKHGVMDRGLWAYSRHPNYFFEWLTWLGFALMSFGSFAGYYVFISPLVILCVFLFLTIPLSEKVSMLSRGEAYKRYCATTSAFLLLPKRKGNAR